MCRDPRFIHMRTVVLEEAAERAVSGRLDHPRIDRMIRGVEWILCRSPEDGTPVIGKPDNHRVITYDPGFNLPAVTFSYWYTADNVHIADMRIAQSLEAETAGLLAE